MSVFVKFLLENTRAIVVIQIPPVHTLLIQFKHCYRQRHSTLNLLSMAPNFFGSRIDSKFSVLLVVEELLGGGLSDNDTILSGSGWHE